MNQFEQEIKRRIKHYYDQLAALENAYYNHEIESKEYVVEYEKIKGKIKLLKEQNKPRHIQEELSFE